MADFLILKTFHHDSSAYALQVGTTTWNNYFLQLSDLPEHVKAQWNLTAWTLCSFGATRIGYLEILRYNPRVKEKDLDINHFPDLLKFAFVRDPVER